MSNNKTRVPQGIAVTAGAAAFTLWGILPVYWKQFGHIDPFVVVCYRVIWSLVTLLLVLLITGKLQTLKPAIRNWLLFPCLPTGLLIAMNWLIFIWAVEHNRVIETSLGYFLNPLCNIVLAIFLLGERVNKLQKLAILIASLAVVIVACTQQGFPWIALMLAGTFSLYSLIKNRTQLSASIGLTLESIVLLPLAIIWLTLGPRMQSQTPQDATTLSIFFWLLSTGPVTTLPLFLFAFAAGRTRLMTIGMLQYLAPSIQLLIGYLIYHEPMPLSRWVVFALVWVSLSIYVYDLVKRAKSEPESKLRTRLKLDLAEANEVAALSEA